MWYGKSIGDQGPSKFFLICLSHESLENHYKTNFMLNRYHKYNLTELDMMIPWEREVHLILLLQSLEEEKQQQQQRDASNGRNTE